MPGSPARKNQKKKPASSRAAAPVPPSTIGRNPLDALISESAVLHVARHRRVKPALVAGPELVAPHGAGPGVKLAITVPKALAEQVQSILAVRTDLSFDQLMSTALGEVLIDMRRRGPKRP